jgi:CelD/BcsL family acetyltransferase involved in cellulose biosynthesis
MHIDAIDDLSAFNALRANWDAVYQADPEAQLFLTWRWLSDWLAVYRTVWFVLAAKRNKTDTEYVAFLPMRLLVDFDKKVGFSNELILAGAAFADYTGFLARPEFEAEVIPAFAEYLKRRLNWAQLTMDNLMISERRRRLFLRGFDKRRFTRSEIEYKFSDDPTNHSICPYINLPASWDEYLRSLSANNRQKIRRLLRKLEESEDCRITLSNAENVDRNLTTLLHFWKIKWAPRKGEKTEGIVRNNHRMLTRCAEHGTLFLPVFWHGDRPIAVFATLIDSCKKSLLFFITGRDETYNGMPAGYLLHAYSIRHAIANGFRTYDFLRGNEPYKYLFSPRERRLRAVSVVTKTKRNLGGRLDPRGLSTMLEMTLQSENGGETEDAERGYRQILETEPNHALGLYRFGRFMAKRGAHAEAKELFSRSVEVEPKGDNAWFLLARSLRSLGEDEAALEACQNVIKLQPQNEDAKKLMVELSFTAKAAEKSSKARVWPVKIPPGKPAPPQVPVKAAAGDPYWDRLHQLADGAVDPNWVLKQLAIQNVTPPHGARRKP